MKKYIVLFAVAVIGMSCGSPYPPDVMETLNMAGENRIELEKVLTHFTNDPDSLKYQAALFLIGNMQNHGYATYRWKDTSDNEITFDVLEYPDYDSLKTFLQIVEKERGELDYEKDSLFYDYEIIESEFLIGQIDYAFKAWREKPWAGHLSFEQFKQYILPYRGSNEPLEPWRDFFWLKYKNIEKQMKNMNDPIEVATIINDDIKSWFTFDRRFYLHPTDQGLREMLETGMGRCEDMTNLTIYAMRANGLAITSDYTPHWANRNNNHAWNTIADSTGEIIQFMGAESNPGQYNLAPSKYAKVYRKAFGENKANLIFQERKQEAVPGWLRGKSYLDVTHEYPNNGELKMKISENIPDSVDIAYLCIFNDGEWRAVDWAGIGPDSSVAFNAVGYDIACILGFYINKEITPCSPPFIFDVNEYRELKPGETADLPITIGGTKPVDFSKPEEKYTESKLEVNKDYELFYWDKNDWQSVGIQKAGKKPLIFDTWPDCLYRLVEVDGNEDERIFTTSDGTTIRWW